MAISRVTTTVAMMEPSVTVNTTSNPDILASACWPTTRSKATMIRKTITDESITCPIRAQGWKNMMPSGASRAPVAPRYRKIRCLWKAKLRNFRLVGSHYQSGADMMKRPALWRALAALFTVINLVGLGWAIAEAEGPHAAAHVALSLLGMYGMWRLSARTGRQDGPTAELAELRLEQL